MLTKNILNFIFNTKTHLTLGVLFLLHVNISTLTLTSLNMTCPVISKEHQRTEKSLCHFERVEKSRCFDASQLMLCYRIANKIVNAYVMHGCSFSPAKTLGYFNYSNYFNITMFSW